MLLQIVYNHEPVSTRVTFLLLLEAELSKTRISTSTSPSTRLELEPVLELVFVID